MTSKPPPEEVDESEEEFARTYAEAEHVPLAQVREDLGLPISDEERAELELLRAEISETEPPQRGDEPIPMPEIPPPPDEPWSEPSEPSEPPPDSTPEDPISEPPPSLETYVEPPDVQRVVISRLPPVPEPLEPSSRTLPTARQVAGQRHVSATSKTSKHSTGTGSRLLKNKK